jgi:flagellar biosynthetic protein FliP
MNLSSLTKLGTISANVKLPYTRILGMLAACLFCFSVFGSTAAFAQTALETSLSGLPALNVINGDGASGTTYSLSLQILALMTALTILPSLVLGMTSFTRVIIVLSILRQAMGTQQTPPNQVLIAIALFLTFFIMAPTFETLYDDAITPYLEGQMAADTAIADGTNVMKRFLVQNTRITDLNMFSDMVGISNYETPEDVPLSVLLPAFITSELKTAFQIGFLLFLPFLVIDMVIASILMSLGMMMLSPMLVAMPFKLLLFVLVDGWAMTVGSLVATYSIGA